MILLVGATGQLGGRIGHRLLAQGKEVRILVRHNSPSEELAKQGLATSAHSLIEAGAQTVYGDLKDPASLVEAVADVEAIITTANSVQRGGEDNIQSVDLEGNRHLIDAARSANVQQFVFVSALGADADSPQPLFRAKGRTESYLVDSGLSYTILVPEASMDVWTGLVVGIPLQAGWPVTLVGEGQRRHSYVAMDDVAAFATAVVGHGTARNRRVIIGGPEPLSWCDIVATFERVLGRSIPVHFVAPGQPIPGIPASLHPVLWGMETFDTVLDSSEAAHTFGVRQTTLEAFLRAGR